MGVGLFWTDAIKSSKLHIPVVHESSDCNSFLACGINARALGFENRARRLLIKTVSNRVMKTSSYGSLRARL